MASRAVAYREQIKSISHKSLAAPVETCEKTVLWLNCYQSHALQRRFAAITNKIKIQHQKVYKTSLEHFVLKFSLFTTEFFMCYFFVHFFVKTSVSASQTPVTQQSISRLGPVNHMPCGQALSKIAPADL